MEILLNGTTHPLNTPCNLATLIAQLELANKRLAVEVNAEIVPRSQFDHYILADGDKVEIVHAIGGG